MWKEFKAFAFKGNLLDLAIAFVLGAAFTALVQAVVADVVTPILSGPGGSKTDFGDKHFFVGHGKFLYGDLPHKLPRFLLIARGLFLLIKLVTRVERLARLDHPEAEAAPAVTPCPFCFETINAHATRCPRCTSELAA